MRHNKTNFLGRFKSLAHVWIHYPCGGNKGDWLSVGHDTYIWNDEQHNWTLDTYANTDSYALIHQTGDLMLMGNMHVGGQTVVRQKAVFKDDVTIEGELHCRRLKGRDRGLYVSYEDLVAAWPAPHTGDWALVGTNATPQLWVCRQHRQWQQEGTVNLYDTFNLEGYNTARSIVEDIAAMGYVFGGVADTTTNPHMPQNYNLMYLTSEPGCYVNFDNIQIRYLSALMWDHNPNLPRGGQWRAHAIMGNVFVDTDNIASGAVTTEKIADGAVTLEKTTGLTNFIDEKVGMESRARASAINDVNSRLAALDAAVVKSVSINSGAKKYPDSQGNVNLVMPQSGGGAVVDESLAAQVEANTEDIAALQTAMENIKPMGEAFPDNSENVVYPETYNAKGDGINFYEWPIACFGGILDEVVVPINETLAKTVPAPSERLFGDIKNIAVNESTGALEYSANNYGLSLTAADVVYSLANHKFLLHYNGNYYSNWRNAGVWNTPEGYPRTDTVYSDISIVNSVKSYNKQSLEDLLETLQAVRVSYVYKQDGGMDINNNAYAAGSLVDIDRLMHDDYTAFNTWLDKVKDGYSLRLTKGKIYYVKIPHAVWNSSWVNTPLYEFGNASTPIDYHGAEIDFGGAVLFLRLDDPWFPHVTKYNGSSLVESSLDTQGQSIVFKIGGSKNLTFKNLTVRAMRDRDGGCVGKNCRLSTSDSALMLFKFSSTSSENVCSDNIKIENLDVTNMTRDFEAEPSNKAMLARLEIDGWKSDGVGWNGIRARNVIIRNADVTTAKYLGGCGYHVFYMKGVDNFICSDSTFRHPDHYNEPMVSYGTGYSVSDSPLTFINCTFDLVYFGYSKNVRFVDCKMMQKHAYYMASGKSLEPFSSAGGYLNMDSNKTELYNCIVYLSHHHLTKNGTGNLLLDNVTVFTTNTFAKKIFIDYSGTAKVRNFKTNYAGDIGLDITDYEQVQRNLLANELNGKMNDINTLVTGGLTSYQGDPFNPEVDDEWYNYHAGEARKCTAAGTPGIIGIYLTRVDNSDFVGPYTGRQSYRVCDREEIIFDFENLTKEDFHSYIRQQMTAMGYEEAEDTTDLRSGALSDGYEGKFYLNVPRNNTNQLMIRTKSAGALPPMTNIRTTSQSNVKKTSDTSVIRPFGSLVQYCDESNDAIYRVIDGTAFTYTVISADGIVPTIGELEKSAGIICVPKTWGTLAPSPAAKGDYWYETGVGLKRHNGSGFVAVDTNGELRVLYDSNNNRLYLAVSGQVRKEITMTTL